MSPMYTLSPSDCWGNDLNVNSMLWFFNIRNNCRKKSVNVGFSNGMKVHKLYCNSAKPAKSIFSSLWRPLCITTYPVAVGCRVAQKEECLIIQWTYLHIMQNNSCRLFVAVWKVQIRNNEPNRIFLSTNPSTCSEKESCCCCRWPCQVDSIMGVMWRLRPFVRSYAKHIDRNVKHCSVTAYILDRHTI